MTNRINIFEGSSADESSNADRLIQLATLQTKMLVNAMNNFPNATKLIYSTCSVNVEENEQVLNILHATHTRTLTHILSLTLFCHNRFPNAFSFDLSCKRLFNVQSKCVQKRIGNWLNHLILLKNGNISAVQSISTLAKNASTLNQISIERMDFLLRFLNEN